MNDPCDPPPERDPAAAAAAPQPPADQPRLWPVVALAVVSLLLPATGLLYAEALRPLSQWLRGHEPASLLVYAGMVTGLAGLALVPTWVQALFGGWTFGLGGGFATVLGGLTAASGLAYAVARPITGQRVVAHLRRLPRVERICRALVGSGTRRATIVVMLLRAAPLLPFSLNNVIFAALRVPLPAVLIGSLLGLAPRTAATVFIGAQLQKLDLHDLRAAWLNLSGIAVTMIAAAVLGLMARHALKHLDVPEPRDDERPAARK